MKLISEAILYQPTMRKHLGLFFVGFLLGAATYGFVNFSGFQHVHEMVLSGLLGVVLGYVAHFSNARINAFLPWQKQPGFRLLMGVLFHFGFGALLVFGALWTYGKLQAVPSLFSEDPNDVLAKIGILLCCTAVLYNIFYFAIHSYHQYAKGQVLELQLERKRTQLQLSALKSQLSPHFLFNSMNILSSLFHKDIGMAESFIRSLGDSYQYVLNKYDDPLVTVGEELTFVEAYFFLIRTRFGDGLTLDVQLPSWVLQTRMPPLTLQMLVENAVKHNVVGPDQALEIRLGTPRPGALSVTNNKTMKRPNIDSLEIGLRNIGARYELLARKSIEVIDTQDFTVHLPLIP